MAKSSAISKPSSRPRATSALEVLERAELRVDRVVAALVAADRPRAAHVALRRPRRVVAALAVRRADRVDRRQVDDVEAELGELRQHLLDALEAAPRAREELVPGAEAGALAVDVDVVGRRPRLLAALARGCGEPLLERDVHGRAQPRPRRARWRDRPGPRRPCAAPRPARTRCGRPRPRRGSPSGPHASTTNEPSHQSLPTGVSGDSRHFAPPRGFQRTAAPSVSWPSRKIARAMSTGRRRCASPGSGRSRPAGRRPGSGSGREVASSAERHVHPCPSGRTARPNPVTLPRSGGILLHPTSLPGGRLGPEAYRFVDWLAAAGQSWWQVLPLGTAGRARLAVHGRVGVRGMEWAAR